jgi:hypothetical protein
MGAQVTLVQVDAVVVSRVELTIILITCIAGVISSIATASMQICPSYGTVMSHLHCSGLPALLPSPGGKSRD